MTRRTAEHRVLTRAALASVVLAGAALVRWNRMPAQTPCQGTVAARIQAAFPDARAWFTEAAGTHVQRDGDALTPNWRTVRHPKVLRTDGRGQRFAPSLPARADGTMRIALDGMDGMWVETTPLDAGGGAAEWGDGIIAYPGAYGAADLLYKLMPTRVDEYVYLPEPAPFLRLLFRVRLGPGVGRLAENGNGLEAFDRRGAAGMRLERPFAYSSDGRRRDGTLVFDRLTGLLALELDLRGLSFPVLVDPDWTTTAEAGPPVATTEIFHPRGGGCGCDSTTDDAHAAGSFALLLVCLVHVGVLRRRGPRGCRRQRLRADGWLVALLMVGAPFASGCRGAGTSQDHLSVGVSLLRISLPVFVAEAQGLFRAHGVEVDLRPYQTAQPMMDDVVAGRLDAGGFVAYPIAFLAAENAGHVPRLATALVEDAGHRLSYALEAPASNLAFPEDAGGRVVGVLPTAAYQRWLAAILRAADVDPGTVKVVPLAPPLEGQALASGAVDFLFTNDPVATTLLERGIARLADRGPACPRYLGEPFAFGTFALSARLADERSQAATRLVAALDDAIAVLDRDPMAGPRAMIPYLRPEERPAAWHYPPTRYLTSAAVAADFIVGEGRRELALGIIHHPPQEMSWTPSR